MSIDMDINADLPAERRQRNDLRQIFVGVVDCVEPYILAGGLNGHPAEYWAARAVREHYPALTPQEARMLTAAAMRYLRDHAGQGDERALSMAP
jgi:hypothetical protein